MLTSRIVLITVTMTAACTVTAPAGPPGTVFYTDPIEFLSAVGAANKVSKFTWNFEPNFLPSTFIVPCSDPLDINTHPDNPIPPWFDEDSGENVWPLEVDNVQFFGNMTPGAVLTPRGKDAIAVAAEGYQGMTTSSMIANFAVDAFDIVSAPPAGAAEHTAFALQLANPTSIPGGSHAITVYDSDGALIGSFDIEVPIPPSTTFLGIVTEDSQVIGRIEIDSQTALKGIASIIAYVESPPCPWDCQAVPQGSVGILDLLALLGSWGVPGPCDFNGGGVNILDLIKLLSNWGPCE